MIYTKNGYVKAPGVEWRADAQKARVKDGRADGTISNKELLSLGNEAADAKQGLVHAKADGKVSLGERVGVHSDLNELSRNIRAYRHN